MSMVLYFFIQVDSHASRTTVSISNFGRCHASLRALSNPKFASHRAKSLKNAKNRIFALKVSKNFQRSRKKNRCIELSKCTCACIAPDGYLRDVLTFTWNNRTLTGTACIAAYLSNTLSPAAITDVKLDTREHLTPTFGPITPAASGITSGFTFETAVGHGQGYFSLLENGVGEWKALFVSLMLVDIRGHEESGPETGIYGGHTITWQDVNRARRKEIERNPHVLIIGGGQGGLNAAARFKQMKIPALIIEANDRIGDNWRKRYPTLTLHTPKSHNPLLYQPNPDNWPIFTPRDKVADWLEQYAISQDLVVWTNSRPLPTPSYDAASKQWTVVIDRAGQHITLNPAHIVISTGALGKPRIPSIPDMYRFDGTKIHCSSYTGGENFSDKRVLIVGAGNSSADVCQDLAFHGAEVTMLQRSTTCVVAADNANQPLLRWWPPDIPTTVSDFKFKSTPFLLLRENAKAMTQTMWEEEKGTHEGLREAGLSLSMGKEGTGLFVMVFERFGGYWIDVGAAELIRSGKIKIKQGVEIARFTESSAIFTDGSSLDIDAVIFATSYESVRDTMRGVFGDAVMDQTSVVWGTDDEGEMNGIYRPSGHPGLWYAVGDFVTTRFYSKQLALEIKAIELGLLTL
ncbi:FAD/NAD-P-binding domain-containing protein [Mycena crocata]|nr:FAD/NAD-P-binding domain-containing protein [Mycena crocata]